MTQTNNSPLDVDVSVAVAVKRQSDIITPKPGTAAKANFVPRVLVADDAIDTRVIVMKTLEFDGYQCLEAASGSEALAKTEVFRPHLVILDLMLPEVSGLQVLLKLRSSEKPPKVCVLSGIDKLETIERAIAMGASDYLVKPVLPDTLAFKVNALLGKSTGSAFFETRCDFVGSVVTQGNGADVCQIEGLSEIGVTAKMLHLPSCGQVLRLFSPSLAKILEREDPVFVRCRHVRQETNQVDLDFVGLPESEVQSLRALIIRGKYLTDDMFSN